MIGTAGGGGGARRGAFPEAYVVAFGFLLNYPWEMFQTPFFAGMAEMRHWDAVVECTRATAGDVGLLLVAFWITAAAQRSRAWIVLPRPPAIVTFVAVGLVATAGLEWVATGTWGRWQYALHMPTLPGIGTGLLPLLQWTVLPPILIWIVRRQLHGAAAVGGR